MSNKLNFSPGHHRPVYLWAGPGTIRMNRLKFMNAPVDETVHLEAHLPVGARRIAREAGFNWVYLTYNWGFPPEIEVEDWAAFGRAMRVYRAEGVRVFGYVQLSNCVYRASYRHKDWYAVDPWDRFFHYYTDRYMTCWLHPGWLAHLRKMVTNLIRAGTDGIFFDNPWYGLVPFHLGGLWLGQAGCYCARCRSAFGRETGLEIPVRLDPTGDPAGRLYLQWRARQVTTTLANLAGYARSLQPEVAISINDLDPVMHPAYPLFGIDLAGLAQIQDVMMMENLGLPAWTGDRLVNNALTLRTARALTGDRPLSVNSYERGIGFDEVYPPRRFRQGLAEAAACGAVMAVKGTEYVQNKTFTLLTAEPFSAQREAIGQYHRWLAGQAHLFEGRRNGAAVGLLYPGQALWQQWGQLAGLYFGVGQTLLAAGIPWRTVTAAENWTGLEALFTFGDRLPARLQPGGVRCIHVPALPGWQPAQPARLLGSGPVNRVLENLLRLGHRAYFEQGWARQVGDLLNLQSRLLASPHFRLPATSARHALLEALGQKPYPQVTAARPVLAELWRQENRWQLHLVNYSREPQPVTVRFGRPVAGQVISPDRPAGSFRRARLDTELDVYAVVQYRTG